MYLANNPSPDVDYAVNQCARFTHCPKDSQTLAVKRILRYFKRVSIKGMHTTPTSSYTIICFVNTDFALWGAEHE